MRGGGGWRAKVRVGLLGHWWGRSVRECLVRRSWLASISVRSLQLERPARGPGVRVGAARKCLARVNVADVLSGAMRSGREGVVCHGGFAAVC